MKDSLLFEFILSIMLDCRNDELDERDQREAILDKLSNLMIEVETGHSELAALEETAIKRIQRLERIKKAARNILGAGDNKTWVRFKEELTEAIEADTSFPRESTSDLDVAPVSA